MRLEYSMELRQTQKLLMTPQLQQAIKLLQLPVLELTEYLDQQYLENPMLEFEDGEDSTNEEEETVEEEIFDIDWEQYFQDRGDVGEPINWDANKKPTFEQFTANAPTLQQRLLQQLLVLTLPRGVLSIARYIIGNLDDNGYLNQPCSEIATCLRVPEAEVLIGLETVQNLDPPGIGARDLRECLLLQLQNRENVPPYVEEIVCKHLDLVAKGRMPVLAERLNVDIAEIQKAVDCIRSLEPKPGKSVGEEVHAPYIFPDITVVDVAGEWIIMVNDSYSFRFRVSPVYYRMLKAAKTNETKKFLQEKFNSALWLLKSLEQRRTTLHRLTEFIIQYQQPFFQQGVKHLRPLRLKDVAEVLDVHESTVSRAVNGKYVQTPRGIFELRYFFSVNLETDDGGGISSTGVKKVLAELVAEENNKNPLTDLELAQCFQERGVKISRRTIAKYRDELSIPSSTLRKRWA